MSPAATTIALLVVVGLIAFIVKWFSRDESAETRAAPDAVDQALAEAQDLEPGDVTDVVAVDSDGWAFVPDGDRVRLIPSPEFDGSPRERPHNFIIGHGDVIGVRVVRGAPDFDPWRLESLGRDREYRAWFFETEDGARAAAEVLERRVVVAPRDEDDEPRPPTAAEFDEARRRDEETEHALDEGEM